MALKNKIIINKYSYWNTNDYYVEDVGDRIASVFDKLIELAARKCDRYSSDVFWDMLTLNDCIREERKFDRILFFRENGVHSVDIESLENYKLYDLKRLSEELCIWRLEHKLTLNECNKSEWVTSLTRVRLKIESC